MGRSRNSTTPAKNRSGPGPASSTATPPTRPSTHWSKKSTGRSAATRPAFDLDHAEAEELARQVEVDHGGYGFIPPSSIYHRFMTGLTGGKMSSSIPASHISLLDDPEEGYDKVKAATTGGRETAEEQREKGGKADECPVYELYAYLLSGDDDEFAKEVYEECVGGDRLCGGCKEQAAELMEQFLEDHQAKREEWEAKLDELDFEFDSDRKRASGD
jgi:tryptophanyl-tRNA synthetase